MVRVNRIFNFLTIDLIHSNAGAKQISALNFIRMGLAIAETPGVLKNAKFKSNWRFKSESDLKLLHSTFMRYLTEEKFGIYLTMRSLFGEEVTRRLANQHQFTAPVV
jgi:hypothetical protein